MRLLPRRIWPEEHPAHRRPAKGASSDFTDRPPSLQPLTRSEIFGLIVEAASVAEGQSRSSLGPEFHRDVSRARVLQVMETGTSASRAAAVLAIVDRITALRAHAPADPAGRSRGVGGAFLLAMHLVATDHRELIHHVVLLERVKTTLRVPDELAEQIIAVVAGGHGHCTVG